MTCLYLRYISDIMYRLEIDSSSVNSIYHIAFNERMKMVDRIYVCWGNLCDNEHFSETSATFHFWHGRFPRRWYDTAFREISVEINTVEA